MWRPLEPLTLRKGKVRTKFRGAAREIQKKRNDSFLKVFHLSSETLLIVSALGAVD